MQNVNLKVELEKQQELVNQNAVLAEAHSILAHNMEAEQQIVRRLERASSKRKAEINTSRLDKEKIFDVEAVERLCTVYRLRFLESKHFKGDIPAEAVRATRQVEANSGHSFSRFFIVAPAEKFRLRDSTLDPILLAELPHRKFYYLFQWGDDMRWYQSILKYPLRHFGTLTICSMAIGAIVATVVPAQFEQLKAEFFYRFFMFSMSSALVLTSVLIAGVMYAKDFSENIWNSRFLK